MRFGKKWKKILPRARQLDTAVKYAQPIIKMLAKYEININ